MSTWDVLRQAWAGRGLYYIARDARGWDRALAAGLLLALLLVCLATGAGVAWACLLPVLIAAGLA